MAPIGSLTPPPSAQGVLGTWHTETGDMSCHCLRFVLPMTTTTTARTKQTEITEVVLVSESIDRAACFDIVVSANWRKRGGKRTVVKGEQWQSLFQSAIDSIY